MTDDKHKEIVKKFNLCSIRPKPKCGDCPHRPVYRNACKPEWNARVKKMISLKSGKTLRSGYQAHHILCVKSVQEAFYSSTLGKRGTPAQYTKWCINKKENMIALPVFGHTVLWYMNNPDKEPPFSSLPQHDWDHNTINGYTDEVTKDLKVLNKEFEDVKHALMEGEIANALDKRSAYWRGELVGRGARANGTHIEWKNRQQGEAYVCHPFSMAKETALFRALPKLDGARDMLVKLMEYINGAGSA